ncbi:PhzF family phenazine biosynthesis protein [Chitiniphilus eburneus]|uniref:PhzF family phenazine biosynthesis protein n=1 Tax=Chitiniphilus eburneus TaxID=2571148 RepID=A0A4U0PZ78_9NEIS|nr:PhzF family phenazine biosynthesis protein [Chitiniphilus eburneus]TJZ72972.1 PhzF family phenazine biosynthesis protein [Chitiniphilus eburneus]
MRRYRYLLLNVFAETHFAGNPLAVFPDAEGLPDDRMQILAQQLNLSETTFVTPSTTADAAVRIFTPGYELPFAGHPTLGTASVVARRLGRETLTLAMPAGIVPVRVEGEIATLTAQPPRPRPAAPAADIAAALGLPPQAVSATPRWLNTGTEQLVVPLADATAVSACRPDRAAFEAIATNAVGVAQALVWAWDGDRIVARFFWVQHGAIGEDYGTGSACANLGGWWLDQHQPLPLAATLIQGQGIDRLAHLRLTVANDGTIQVGGRVVVIGEGEIIVPA